jgi:hypothetical protein
MTTLLAFVLAHAAHWALYAVPVLVLTVALTVFALLESRLERREPPPEDGET